MAKTVYHRTALTGGGASALDGIDGALLLDEDLAFVNEDNIAYMFMLDASLATTESSPDRILPDVNPGTKVWLLQNLLSTGFTSTSSTPATVDLGSVTITIETNKGFVTGMSVKIAETASPATWMHGDVVSYVQATGELIVNITNIGSGSAATASAWTVSASAPASSELVYSFSRGATLLNAIDGITAVNVWCWRANVACIVTAIKGWRVGGTGATVNARRNGADNHLVGALSLVNASTVYDGGAVQNTAYAIGDYLEVMVVSVAGAVSQIGIQVDFERA